MGKDYFKLDRGGRVIISIVFFILLVIAAVWVYRNTVIGNIKNNPQVWVQQKSKDIKNSVSQLFNQKQEKLISISGRLKQNLKDTLKYGNTSYGSLVQLVNENKYKNYSLEVIAPNGKLIAWNDNIAIQQDEIFPLQFSPGETFFHNSPLVTYLSYTDTLNVQNDIFYFILSEPFEKKYKIQNAFYKEISFRDEVNAKFYTTFQIDYDYLTPESKDGRYFSFDLLNNNNKKIGVVTFQKPSVSFAVQTIDKQFDNYISLLIFVFILVIAFAVRKTFKRIESAFIKFLLTVVLCATFRIVLFLLNFPANFLTGPLVDPSYFSSPFAFGIVRTPIEFFVTNIFLVVIAISFFNYFSDLLKKSDHNKSYKWFNFLISIVFLILFFLVLRGLAASVRSIVFDSTLRYFKEPELIPNLPSFWMNLNLLLIGFSCVTVMSGFIIYLFRLIYTEDKKSFLKRYWLLFIIVEVVGILFVLAQNEPLITPVLSIIFIFLVFLVSLYAGYFNIKSVYNFIYFTIAASIITVTLLNNFNLDLERTSLKTTAYEINRPNETLFQFIIDETLRNAVKNPEVESAFSNTDENYFALAFKMWSNSTLQKESLKSAIFLIDSTGNLLGGFTVGIRPSQQVINLSVAMKGRPVIYEFSNPEQTGEKMFSGVIPIYSQGKLVGYVSAVVNFTRSDFSVEKIPIFLKPKSNFFNTVVNINQLKVFEFTNKKLTYVYGDIYPSRTESEKILNANYSKSNEAWLNQTLSGENFITYALRTNDNGNQNITAVSLAKKNVSWNLFNFFKVFIIHIILIVILWLIIFLARYKNFNYSFRIQLLISLLLVSIIPLIILAFYNQYIVAKRTESSIFEELSQRSNYVADEIRDELGEANNMDKAFYTVSRELGITFSIYDGSNRIFSSKREYYRNGLLSSKLNPQAYYSLFYQTYREYLTNEKIENFNYNAFYRKVTFNNKEYVIGVNDAFNRVKLTFSTVDIDVFLFGIYSFATLIIILVSTFLANRISLPIRKLTRATTAAAHGDLNISVSNAERGELKELVDGFNYMVEELKKNQIEIAELERESAWKEMAKQVAHEIKNPLTPMKLAVQQLVSLFKEKSPNFNSVFEKLSGTILNQIENLSLIASEFSRFAKMPSINLEKLNLIDIIKDVVNLYSEEEVEIQFVNELNEAFVESDKTQLRRAFINLIRNSIQAGASKITVSLKAEENLYDVSVVDNGNGIPEQFKEKIFEGNFTTKKHGMGIGLKLTKRFMENAGGNIYLVRSGEYGTTFKLEIPILK